MEKNNGMNHNIFYVVIVAIVAIVGMVTLLSGSGSKTTYSSDGFFTSDNVAGHAFGGSIGCYNWFQNCIYSNTNQIFSDEAHMTYCMNQYELCEAVNYETEQILR